jgi:hypothetical protein
MSRAQPKRTCYDEALEAELARWPGVTWRREVRSKHYALVLDFGGLTRFHIYPSTPGDTTRGPLNQVRDLRAMLKGMGAVRLAEPKATGPKRQRNRTEAKVPRPVVELRPVSDPLAGLAAFRRKLVDQTPFVLPIKVTTGKWWGVFQ